MLFDKPSAEGKLRSVCTTPKREKVGCKTNVKQRLSGRLMGSACLDDQKVNK